MPRSKELSDQMRAHSQAQILAAARQLFATQGYFNCRVSEIAREAGMSPGNVYWYFSSKEEVLKAVLADGFQAQEDLLAEVAAQPGTSRDRVDLLLDRYLGFCREHSDFMVILMSLMAHGGVPFLNSLGFDMEQLGATYHFYLSRILDQAQRDGIVTQGPTDILAMSFFGFFSGLMMVYGLEGLEQAPHQFRSAAGRLLGIETSSSAANDLGAIR